MVVAATTALKCVQYTFMLFFIGMCFFPEDMLAAYKMDLSCPKKSKQPCNEKNNTAFLYSIMSIMGVQMLSLVSTMSAISRKEVSIKAQSVACFVTMFVQAFFIVNDAMYVMADNYPASMPKEGIVANVVLFGTLMLLCYFGWKDAGGIMPNWGNIIPEGRFALPYVLGCVNLLFFGVPLTFFRASFIEMYPAAAAAAKELTPDLEFFMMWMFGNVGKMICLNVISNLLIISAEPKKEDTLYRLMRASSLVYMFYLGAFSKDAIINLLMVRDDPMRTVTFVQSFAVTFLQIQSWAGASYKLDKTAKA